MHSIYDAQITLLVAKKTIILNKYWDYIDFFLKTSVASLSELTKINEDTMNLKLGKQPLYNLIYNLRSIELKTFKTCIQINLTNRFI